MVHFGNLYKSAFGILFLMNFFLLYSCKEKEDFSYPSDGTIDSPYDEVSDADSTTLPQLDLTVVYEDTIHNDSIQTAKIQVLQTHTVGKGFPIIIMADGYTDSNINDGTYRSAVQKAQTALFAMEPMKSLKQYFDVIEVAVASEESGITSTPKNTAFRTYYDSGTTTEVHGDSLSVKKWTRKALADAYDITASSALDYKFERCQTIVLLNCSAYKGITLLTYDSSVTDGYPLGFGLSYIPASATINTRDVFTDLIQHEAVGHGIGKLADEYFYPSPVSPSTEDITRFQTMQKYGMMQNASYDTDAAEDEYAMTYTYNGVVSFVTYKHPLYASDAAYPLTLDPRYINEDIMWYQGGYTYLTYTDEQAESYLGFACKKEFYRPSLCSTMNATTDPDNKAFNAVSRLAIYKRVMRAALGSLFTCDLTEADDLEAFATFDAPSCTSASGAKGTMSNAKGGTLDGSVIKRTIASNAPTLARPILIKQ